MIKKRFGSGSVSLYVVLAVAVVLFFSVTPLLPAQVRRSADGRPVDGSPAGERPSVALVLAGGGAKGYAHLPVLEVIEEMGIPVDMVIGTSAGAIVGGLYSAGYSPAELREILFNLDWSSIFLDRPVSSFERQLGSQSLERNPLNLRFSQRLNLNLGRGFTTGQEAYKLFRTLTAKIPSYIDFDDLPIPFRASGVELSTGRLEIFSGGDLAEAIRASMSLPGVFEPFNIDGRYYIDGGVLNNLPVDEARALGYDIVIAVDLPGTLDDGGEDSSISPLTTLNQTMTIYHYANIDARYALADVVLIPDVERFSILDFPKAQEIYAQVEQQKELFRKALEGIRNRVHAGAAASSGGSGASPAGPAAVERIRYDSLREITVIALRLSGTAAGDEAYIRRRFDRHLAGQVLTREALAAFMDDVYRTGNYHLLAARIDLREEPLLELRLFPTNRHNAYLALGADFQITAASDVFTKFIISLTTQYRGLTGPGSVLSVGGTLPHVLSAQGLYFQPLGHTFFFSARGRFAQDQDFISSGFTWQGRDGSSVSTAEASAALGIRADGWNTISLGASYTAGAYAEGVSDYLSFIYDMDRSVQARALGIFVRWEHSRLDFPVFPRRGLSANLEGALYFPGGGEPVFTTAKAEWTAALPVSRRVSLALNGFAGSELGSGLHDLPHHLFFQGYGTADRLFFPQISGRQRFGAHKAAALGLVQFQPFYNATIIDADLFFALAFSGGAVFNRPAELTGERIYWAASLNTGLRFTRSFGAVLRLGAGRGEHPGIAPLVSLDLGTIRY